MECDLNQEEEKITNEFVRVVNEVRLEHNVNPISKETALKFVIARKFDLNRALLLYEAHETVRLKERLINFNPDKEPLKSELESGKFTILSKPDAEGAIITMFTASKHLPSASSHQTTLQGIVYQLDIALENLKAQKSGIVFIYNMTNSKYSNFDYELSQKILNLLKGAFPARLKKVLIVTAPLWFKAPFKILRLFVREKLRDRVYMINQSHLPAHIPLSSLPIELGGEIKLDHRSWLDYYRTHRPQTWRELSDIAACNNYPIFTTSNLKNSAILNLSSNGSLSDEDDSLLMKSSSMKSLSVKSESLENNSNNQINYYSGKGKGFFNKPKPKNILLPNNSMMSENLDSAKNGKKIEVQMFESLHGQSDKGMTPKEFAAHLKHLQKNGLINEYSEIPHGLSGTCDFSQVQINRHKNRYKDIPCYDHSAVKLSVINDDPNSTYINANYVDGYNQKAAFISTQGPLNSTFPDFWRMIWEQQVVVIVMTTHTIEKSKAKCGQYWPLEKDTSATFGSFLIINKDAEQFGDFSVTKLTITHNLTGVTRDVTHMHFLSWPDYGVPTSSCAMLKFREKVREVQLNMTASIKPKWTGHPLGPPIVVHCSAGVGRTGTFITLDICIFRLEDTGLINIKETVEKIRSQRAYSIQMPDQYVFCYNALYDYIVSRGLFREVDA